jgi:hypothetical protein
VVSWWWIFLNKRRITMSSNFKTVEFTCKFKMEINAKDNMTEEQIKETIYENFETVIEYGSNDFDESDEYSAYMTFDNIENIKIIE